jgi:hypothetical protein
MCGQSGMAPANGAGLMLSSNPLNAFAGLNSPLLGGDSNKTNKNESAGNA